METRLAAVKTLLRVVRDRQSLTTALHASNNDVPPEKKPLHQQMCYGLLRHYYSLQKTLSLFVTKPLPPKNQDIELLLLLGIYQLEFMKMPPHASVNETVEVTTALGKKWAKGLVNGVLRRFLREKSRVTETFTKDPVFCFDHPDWLITMIQQAWLTRSEKLFSINNEQAPMTLRVNRLKSNRDEFMAALEKNEISCRPCQHASDGITLEAAMEITAIPGFDAGWFSVQDEASQLAAGLLDLSKGQSVLDACAAPGGKSCHILESMPGVELLSLDLDSERLPRIIENMQRLDLSSTVAEGDALTPQSWWTGIQFDRILLDAPCSATGIIRRHPDIKLLRKPSDIDKLAKQQAALLDSLWPLLKKNGLLVYSTCSVLPQENLIPVTDFLARTHDATELLIDASWGIEMPVGRQLLPAHNGHDGFYYARLQKI